MFPRILDSCAHLKQNRKKHLDWLYLGDNIEIIEGLFINLKSQCCVQNKEGWVLGRERQLLSVTLLVILQRI